MPDFPVDPDDLLPQDADDESSDALLDDDETPDTDEAMAGGLSDDDAEEEDEESALEDDDDEEDAPLSDADLKKLLQQTLRDKQELEQKERQRQYEEQNRRNQAYWDDIESQAVAAFDYEEARIWEEAPDAVDPDAYLRRELAKHKARIADWYKRFYASQNASTRQQYERASIPAYASEVAQYFGLSKAQRESLLDFDPKDMPRIAALLKQQNDDRARLAKGSQQAQRKLAQGNLAKNVPNAGGGRAPAKKVRPGSLSHLVSIFAEANR